MNFGYSFYEWPLLWVIHFLAPSKHRRESPRIQGRVGGKKLQFLRCLGFEVVSSIFNRISSSTAHGSEEFHRFLWLVRDSTLWWPWRVCVWVSTGSVRNCLVSFHGLQTIRICLTCRYVCAASEIVSVISHLIISLNWHNNYFIKIRNRLWKYFCF